MTPFVQVYVAAPPVAVYPAVQAMSHVRPLAKGEPALGVQSPVPEWAGADAGGVLHTVKGAGEGGVWSSCMSSSRLNQLRNTALV